MRASASAHIVTGATGFVGAALVVELLERTDAEIFCLCRPLADAARAWERLRTSLWSAAHGYGRGELRDAIAKRCHAIPADILVPRCGVLADQLPRGAELWHSAASLEFDDTQRDRIFAHNLGGTRSVLELAQACRVSSFNYVSTAYVAGQSSGRILETLVEPGAATNNCYEASKVEAELLVVASGISARILRPSVVIGHSRTAHAAGAAGYYGYIRRMRTYRRYLERYAPASLRRPIKLRAAGDCPINLIPVDAVAAAAVQISLAARCSRVFHLTNRTPPTVGLALASAHHALGLPDVEYVDTAAALSPSERRLDDALVFYRRYMTSAKDFDTANTDAVLAPTPAELAWPMRAEDLRRHARTYLASLGAARR